MKKWYKTVIRLLLLTAVFMILPQFEVKAATKNSKYEMEIFVNEFKGADKKLTGSVELFSKNAYAINQGEGKPVKGAKVYFKYKGKTYSAKTNAKGKFVIKKVPAVPIDKKLKVFAVNKGFKKKSTVVTSEAVGEMSLIVDTVNYGALKMTGRVTREDGNFYNKGLAGVKVSFKYKNKTYSGKTNKAGKFAIKNIPVLKSNNYGTVIASKAGFRPVTYKAYVASPYEDSDIEYNYSLASGKTQSGTIINAHRGDTLKITIGKKTYTMKVAKNAKKLKYKINTTTFQAGSTVRIQLISKFDTTWVDKTDVIYGYTTFKEGDTKEHVLLTTGYRNPTRQTYSSDGDTWYYGYSNYIKFDTNGKVSAWYFDN